MILGLLFLMMGAGALPDDLFLRYGGRWISLPLLEKTLGRITLELDKAGTYRMLTDKRDGSLPEVSQGAWHMNQNAVVLEEGKKVVFTFRVEEGDSGFRLISIDDPTLIWEQRDPSSLNRILFQWIGIRQQGGALTPPEEDFRLELEWISPSEASYISSEIDQARVHILGSRSFKGIVYFYGEFVDWHWDPTEKHLSRPVLAEALSKTEFSYFSSNGTLVFYDYKGSFEMV